MFQCSVQTVNKLATSFTCTLSRPWQSTQILKTITGECIGPTRGPDDNWLLECTNSLGDTIQREMSHFSEGRVVSFVSDWINSAYNNQERLSPNGYIGPEYSDLFKTFSIGLCVSVGVANTLALFSCDTPQSHIASHVFRVGMWFAIAIALYANG